MESVTPDQPKSIGILSNADILFGTYVPAIDRLKIISSEAFEDIIREWIWGYLIKRKIYQDCKKCSGGGDKGRDVIAIADELNDVWDNYQCKHYDHPLAPTDIWLELGKFCYYTFTKEYSLPRAYFFMSPQGIGPKFNGLLEKPETLKSELLAKWDKECKSNITTGSDINLTEDLKEYISKLDFSIFKGCDPQRLINELKKTSYFAGRFGGGLIKPRTQPAVPTVVASQEMVYTRQLLDAYADHTKVKIEKLQDIEPLTELKEHFTRQRESFYSADALRQFSRDNLPPDVDYFEDLKDEVFTGVVDVCNKKYDDGYARVIATTVQAKNIQLNSSALNHYINQKDREGICHHLSNDNRLAWVKK
jgi:hypothetical protein